MSCGFWGVCPSRWRGSRETRSLVLTPGQGTESLSDLCVSVKGGGGASPLSFFISATPDSCPVVVMNDSRDTKKRQAVSCVALSVFTHSYPLKEIHSVIFCLSVELGVLVGVLDSSTIQQPWQVKGAQPLGMVCGGFPVHAWLHLSPAQGCLCALGRKSRSWLLWQRGSW